jgi:hypothetical protein
MDSINSATQYTRRVAGAQLAALAASASAAVAASVSAPISWADALAVLGRQAPPDPVRRAALTAAA